MTARALMLQGTGSDVGKSVLVAALCRIARRKGMSVAPFKPQNMSNNAHACADGGEIGRAQALQALAAGVEPRVDFNPVLLKPETDRVAQVVVHGEVVNRQDAAQYMAGRDTLLQPVLASFQRLSQQYDLVLVEGAGSPAEVNLRARDIANMGFARGAGVPVCLVGDIDRGGVIAALVGTQAVLDRADAAHVRAFLINKFRGDQALFDNGVKIIEQATNWPCKGVIPWLSAAARLPAEDAVVLQAPAPQGTRRVKIVVPMLSRIANFDDLDPLRQEPHVTVAFIPPGTPLPRDADVIVLPGTKSTIGDLRFFREQGWHHDLYAHVRAGGNVFGLCGGYQMLGQDITDTRGIDGSGEHAEGLGLLSVSTRMQPAKTTQPVTAICLQSGSAIAAYEIHAGATTGTDQVRALFSLSGRLDGASTVDGRVQGCYLHGLFANDAYRRWWLEGLRVGSGTASNYAAALDNALDELADEVGAHCDVDALLALAEPVGWQP